MYEQLELRLGDVQKVVPWGGRSPRDLTRAKKVLFFNREGQRTTDLFGSGQLDLFGDAITKRPPYGGASTLLPLPEIGG